MHYKKYEN
nr:hypothetical protein [Tanacetum cinerariifolium]